MNFVCPLCAISHSLKDEAFPPLFFESTDDTMTFNLLNKTLLKDTVDDIVKLLYLEGEITLTNVASIEGYYSMVLKGILSREDNCDQEVAIKLYHDGVFVITAFGYKPIESSPSKFHREIYALALLNSQTSRPDLIEYFGYGVTKDHCPFIIESYCGTSLSQLFSTTRAISSPNLLEPFDELQPSKKPKVEAINTGLPTIDEVVRCCVTTLKYCHRLNSWYCTLRSEIEYYLSFIVGSLLNVEYILFNSKTKKLTVADWNSVDSVEHGCYLDLNSLGRIILRLLFHKLSGSIGNKELCKMLESLRSPWKNIITDLLAVVKGISNSKEHLLLDAIQSELSYFV